jgi:CBS domain containing-hemolysin-like protein
VIASAIFIIAALIFINAVYVAAEFSAVGVRRSRIRQLADDGNPFAAWLLPRIESPAALDRYIAACQIGITLSSLALGAYAQRTIAVWLTPVFVGLGGLQEIAAQSTSAVVVLFVLTAAPSSTG